MNVLGISAFFHDSAAALVSDGRIMGAVQEERFTRKKFDAAFPAQSIAYCLAHAGLAPGDVDAVVFYDNPRVKFDRIVKTHLSAVPKGLSGFLPAAMAWLGGKIDQRRLIARGLSQLYPGVDWDGRISFHEHHASHAASAFYPSQFRSAAVLTMDGVGEWATTTIAHGRNADLEMVQELHFPHSLGMLYSAFTDYLGFRVNSDEYKVMGLAPYGQPKFADVIFRHLIEVKDDGSFRLNMEHFAYHFGRRMIAESFCTLFGQPQRKKADPLTQFHMDIGASIQKVTEDVVKVLAAHALKLTGERHLCLAGGVALNCVANGKLLGMPGLDGLWIQPAAGDAGGALGAALGYYYAQTKAREPAPSDAMEGALLGPSYTNEDITAAMRASGARWEALAFEDDDALCRHVAGLIAGGKVIGWCQGRMEFGPRALGARSIIGDPRNAAHQRRLNLKVKFRESFRPFAPVVLEEHAADWFDLDVKSPYMMLVAPVAEKHRIAPDPVLSDVAGVDLLEIARSVVPAVTHVDYSARVQTVGKGSNPRFRKLLEAFYALTGCPVLINTSFNVNDEPIVCSPEDAIRCFRSTNIDHLCIGKYVLDRPAESVRSQKATAAPETDPDNIYTVF